LGSSTPADVWQSLSGRRDKPAAVETVWQSNKSAVFRLRGAGPAGRDVIAKLCPPDSFVVERAVHEQILPRLPLSSLACYGSVEGDEACWLFLEDARGERYSSELQAHVYVAARWLAILHMTAYSKSGEVGLPRREIDHYLSHVRSARSRILGNLGNPALETADIETLQLILVHLDRLEAAWPQLTVGHPELPTALVHGDFVDKNIRLQDGSRLLVFDWENAGWGFPAADIAQLAEGPVSGLHEYWATVVESWPTLSFDDVQRVARLGRLLRLMAAMDWEASRLGSDWIDKPIARFRRWNETLARRPEL
jgi:hypothetical protein